MCIFGIHQYSKCAQVCYAHFKSRMIWTMHIWNQLWFGLCTFDVLVYLKYVDFVCSSTWIMHIVMDNLNLLVTQLSYLKKLMASDFDPTKIRLLLFTNTFIKYYLAAQIYNFQISCVPPYVRLKMCPRKTIKIIILCTQSLSMN